MRQDRLRELSVEFAVSIIHLVQRLQNSREYIISKQIGKSGTSIGANIREANYGQSTADFVSKLQIALKEANETDYWLELLYRTNYLDKEQYRLLQQPCKELRLMLIASIRTASANI